MMHYKNIKIDKMKKILTVALAVITLQFAATAQTERATDKAGKQKSTEMRKQKALENMADLNLTEAQKKQMETLKAATKEQAKSIKASSATQEEKKVKMQEVRKANKAKMKSILTTEQKNILKAKKTEAKKDGKKRGDKAGRMDGDTKAQMKEKVKNMSPEMKEKLRAIKNDQSLTQEQRKAAIKKLMIEKKGK